MLTSCSPLGREDSASGFYEESEAPKTSRLEAASPSGKESDSFDDIEVAADESVPVKNENADRKRIYNGSAGIVVENAEETRRNLESFTQDSGGYVESSFSEYLVLRVPAEKFDEIFKSILRMGDVEYSRVETWDVTEAFADTERRLITAEETRNRLYTLLEESKDPSERARILREIGRLTEEIESLKQQLSIMTARISFSRITVQLIPRIQGDYSRDNIPFPWIAYIDPLVPAGDKIRGKVTLDLGSDFAIFTRESVFMAEDSSGNHILISTVLNDPRGDNLFWRRALAFHLKPYYSELKEIDISFGDKTLLGVELVSKDREPFRYFVGIIADRKDLHVIEVFSPDAKVSFDEYYQIFAEGSIK